jgi:hypothetical protein
MEKGAQPLDSLLFDYRRDAVLEGAFSFAMTDSTASRMESQWD